MIQYAIAGLFTVAAMLSAGVIIHSTGRAMRLLRQIKQESEQ